MDYGNSSYHSPFSIALVLWSPLAGECTSTNELCINEGFFQIITTKNIEHEMASTAIPVFLI